MSDSVVFDRTVELMQDRLNLSAVNQNIISSNIANRNTPRYVSKTLSFKETLRESLEENVLHLVRSHDKHLDPLDIHEAMKSPDAQETGPVDLDWEMTKLSENSIEYQFIVTMLSKKLSLLKQAIGP